MASRKPSKEKSKPFTSFNYKMKIVVCGDRDYQESWESLFKNKKISKSEFLNEEIEKSLGKEDYENFLDHELFKEFNEKFWKELLNKLHKKDFHFASKQDFIRYLVEKKSEEENEKTQ